MQIILLAIIVLIVSLAISAVLNRLFIRYGRKSMPGGAERATCAMFLRFGHYELLVTSYALLSPDPRAGRAGLRYTSQWRLLWGGVNFPYSRDSVTVS